MEDFIVNHALFAHWIVFGLFMLAGLNLPVSEDVLIIASGVIASTIVPEHTAKLFTAVFLGAYISDILVYTFGRVLGPNLQKTRLFGKLLAKKRIDKISNYYKKYGVLTLLLGRFIPFGVRNCLFATAGIGKMALWKFLLYDGVACIITNTALFTASFFLGKKMNGIVRSFNLVIFALFVIALIAFVCYKRLRVKKSVNDL